MVPPQSRGPDATPLSSHSDAKHTGPSSAKKACSEVGRTVGATGRQTWEWALEKRWSSYCVLLLFKLTRPSLNSKPDTKGIMFSEDTGIPQNTEGEESQAWDRAREQSSRCRTSEHSHVRSTRRHTSCPGTRVACGMVRLAELLLAQLPIGLCICLTSCPHHGSVSLSAAIYCLDPADRAPHLGSRRPGLRCRETHSR